MNIGTKSIKDKRVVLGLVTPPNKRRTSDPHAKYTMVEATYDPDALLKISHLP